MLHTVILFVHIVSAMGIFAAAGVESMVLAGLARVTDDASAGASLANFRAVKRVEGPSVGLTLLSGLTLAGVYWGWTLGWIDVTIGSVVLIVIVGTTMTGRALGAFKAAPTLVGARAAWPILRRSFLLRVWILAGIVFVMTNKLPLWPSVIAIVIAVVLGIVMDGVIASRTGPSMERSAAVR